MADVTDQQPATAARGPYPKGIARRQEILDRAIEVFARRGSKRTSLRAIAEEVGVTHAALKHYFGSLDELLVAVYRASEERGARDAHPADATPVEVMREAASRNRAVPGLVQLYSTLVASALEEEHPAAREFATGRFAWQREHLAERVRRNQASGRIRPDVDPVAVAALAVAASDGLQTQWLLDGDAPQEAALALLDGLLAPPAAEPTAS